MVKFSSILETSPFKESVILPTPGKVRDPRNEAVLEKVHVSRDMSVFVKIWINSNAIFSCGVSRFKG